MLNSTTRKRAWKVGPALGLAFATAFALGGPIAPAGAVTPKLYASPTGTSVTCAHNNPCTLSHALSIAPSGTTIELAAGVYDEQPTITTSNLTIEGPSNATATLEKTAAVANATTPAQPSLGFGSHPMTALVYVAPGTTGFTLSRVTIDGSHASLPSADRFSAVFFRSSSGTLDHVTSAHVFPAGGFDGNQNGTIVDVRSDPAATSNVTLTKDTITQYNKTGVACFFAGTTCNISQTTVTGAGPTTVTAENGIQISNGATGSVAKSTITGNAYTPAPQAAGILIYDAGNGVSVSKNTLSANDSNIYAYSDATEPAGFTSANVSIARNHSTAASAFDGVSIDSVSGASVTQNTLSGNPGSGIGLYGATGATVSKNKVSSNAGDGIYVGGPGLVTTNSTSNNISNNKATSNTGAGLHADTTSSGNTFASNGTTNNQVGHDIFDQGTGNFWGGNRCTTHASSTPGGLC